MQFTILSTKLPNQSTPQFIHEFRNVHATETISMANSLGIISRYVQGLALSSAGQQDIKDLPLPAPREPLISFAQLTWPALEVLQGSLQTQGYKNSAGKHIFADAREIFLTERLEPDVGGDGAVRLVFVLVPEDSDGASFMRLWDEHAAFCRGACARYQRNRLIEIDQARVSDIFRDTQFPAERVRRWGGYEEFVFESNPDAIAFCQRHGDGLRDSYAGFTSKDSYGMGFDSVAKYDDTDRGYKQIVTGGIVGSVLRAKFFLGF
jgi:hypothetical protein